MTYLLRLRPSGRPAAVSACRLVAVGLSVAALTAAAVTPAQAQPGAGSRHVATGWRVVKLIGTKNVIPTSVAAVSSTDAWIGAARILTASYLPALYQLNRGRLKTVVPAGGAGVFVADVIALSASNVWATEADSPFVLHLGPRGWSRHSLAIGSDDILIAGVVPVSAKSVWVVDYDFTTKIYYSYHYNGKTWIQRKLPYGIDADADEGLLSGTSDSNLWGLSFTGPGGTANAVRYNGKKWLVTDFPAHLAPVGYTLYSKSIYAQSPKSVWATLYSAGKTSYGPLVLLHWNGKRWSKISGKLPKAVLQGPITSDGHGGLWMYASATNGLSGFFLHYVGGRWSTVKMPTARASHQPVTVLSMDVAPRSQTVFASGEVADEGLGGDAGAAVLQYTP
jgi:hypothetical protein